MFSWFGIEYIKRDVMEFNFIDGPGFQPNLDYHSFEKSDEDIFSIICYASFKKYSNQAEVAINCCNYNDCSCDSLFSKM